MFVECMCRALMWMGKLFEIVKNYVQAIVYYERLAENFVLYTIDLINNCLSFMYVWNEAIRPLA